MEEWTIQTIKQKLEDVTDPDDPFLVCIASDERKGVQKLIASWQRKYDEKRRKIIKYDKLLSYEKSLHSQGYQKICGIDEAGRGPLAGPVVAACVCLDSERPIYGLDDSKKLSAKVRDELFDQIIERASAYGIGVVEASEIDRLGIRPATHLAMTRAYESMDIQGDFLLIDAERLDLSIPQQSLIKGDQKSNSIAAASILAKCTRDRLMVKYAEMYPEYYFAKHMGYGTALHLEALEKYGPCRIHRKSFAPVKKFLK